MEHTTRRTMEVSMPMPPDAAGGTHEVPLAIKPNNCACRGPCGVCGDAKADPPTPYAMFLADSFAPVCRDCATRIDPTMMWLLDLYQHCSTVARTFSRVAPG